MKQRVAARLLLASCTLALGLGLGTAVAVTGILAVRHPMPTVRAPGETSRDLDAGVHELFVLRNEAGGGLQLVESRPSCTVTDLRSGRQASPASSGAGFAALRVERSGRHRVACTAAAPVTVSVRHVGTGLGAYLAAVGRGLFLAVVLTVLAALLGARALVTAGRLRPPSTGPGAPPVA